MEQEFRQARAIPSDQSVSARSGRENLMLLPSRIEDAIEFPRASAPKASPCPIRPDPLMSCRRLCRCPRTVSLRPSCSDHDCLPILTSVECDSLNAMIRASELLTAHSGGRGTP